MSDESKQSTEPTTLLPASEQVQEGQAPKREPSPYETAMQIADQLGERAEGARKQLVRIVAALVFLDIIPGQIGTPYNDRLQV
jgi:hypothetical protein